MYALFVLDFDETFDLEKEESLGVPPSVYLIKAEDMQRTVAVAQKAHEAFHDDDKDVYCIGEWFDALMQEEGIFYKYVGDIEIPFGERYGSYISKIGFASI